MIRRVPPLVAAILGALPQYPPAALLSAALNLFARDLFSADDKRRLDGRIVCLEVRDAGLRLALRVTPRGVSACGAHTPTDATVSADTRDFLRLAVGSADPDTLFFDRRLLLEGDTEVALVVKNAFDRATLPLPPGLLSALRRRIE